MQVDFRSNIREVIGWAELLHAEQIPFAVALALTETARQGAEAQTAEIDRVFERPTTFTKRAVGYTPARKAALKSVIFIKRAQAQYLFAQVEGGKRDVKRFEKRFGAIDGAVVSAPGKGARLNHNGNLSKAQILKLAAELNSSGSAKRYFKGTPRGHAMPPGIYARVNRNSRIEPVLVFSTKAVYQKRYAFSAVAARTVNARFADNLSRAWERALQTAR